jgi:hypothetical protein
MRLDQLTWAYTVWDKPSNAAGTTMVNGWRLETYSAPAAWTDAPKHDESEAQDGVHIHLVAKPYTDHLHHSPLVIVSKKTGDRITYQLLLGLPSPQTSILLEGHYEILRGVVAHLIACTEEQLTAFWADAYLPEAPAGSREAWKPRHETVWEPSIMEGDKSKLL